MHLYVHAPGLYVLERFYVVQQLSVPCFLGTAFINKHVEAIKPRLRRVEWQRLPVDKPQGKPMPTPILAALNGKKWERPWADQPTPVRACRQVRLPGRTEA